MYRSDYAQEADPIIRGICGAHGGHATAEVRDVRGNFGGRGLRGEGRKRVDGMFSEQPQSFRYKCRPVNDCSLGRQGMAQDVGTKSGTFHGEIDRCRKR